MKEIKLTQGKVALVDDEDYNWVNQKTWQAQVNHCGIFYACSAYRREKMHRVIMGLQKGDKRQVDHINHDGLDNRRCNLRICTNSQNCMNGKHKGGSSKYKGVTYHKKSNRWQAQIQIEDNNAAGKRKHIRCGSHKTEKDAAIAYNNAAIKYFGEFAHLNILGNDK